MKQNPFGLHVMDFNVPDDEMWAYYRAARPAMTVILNNHLRAQQVKATYPEMIVVHRQYHVNDPKWFTLITAAQWVESNRVFGSNGVVVACLNEPGGDFRFDAAYRERFIDWLIAVMDEAKRARIKLALPNWSVGNPHESTIENGGFDRLLRRVSTAGDAVYWSCHEYWHDDPAAEYPFTIGRNEFWTDRVAELGLPPLHILLTEYGMDTGGGGGDGWRNQGVSDEAYADQFKASRTKLKNKPPGAIYGFGEGFGWGSFNIAGSRVPELLEDYQEELPMPVVTPAPNGLGAAFTTRTAVALKLRSTPSIQQPEVRVIPQGVTVTVYQQPRIPGGDYVWVYTQDGAGNSGYTAVEYAPGKPSYDPPLPAVIEPPPAPHPTPEEVAAALEALNEAKADNAAVGVGIDNAIALIKGELLPAAPNTVTLGVPFVSQRGSDADISNNDCLIASLLMMTRFAMKTRGFLVPDVPTVDDVIPYTPLKANPAGLLTFNDGIALAKRLGFSAVYRHDLTPDAIRRTLDGGTPLAVLLDYSVYYLAGAKIPHILVVSGYDGDEFITQDPYLQGANKRVSAATLDAAMKTAPLNSGSYQGMVLAA